MSAIIVAVRTPPVDNRLLNPKQSQNTTPPISALTKNELAAPAKMPQANTNLAQLPNKGSSDIATTLASFNSLA
jgi:hypothetical protein